MGKILVIEFDENDSSVFDEVIKVLGRHTAFETVQIKTGDAISLPGLSIYPDRRKIFRNRQEIHLTAKEYNLLCLLAENRGRVMTYPQIYENVWGAIPVSKESTIISFHIRSLRKKLYIPSANAPLIIRCVREVGYCLEVTSPN